MRTPTTSSHEDELGLPVVTGALQTGGLASRRSRRPATPTTCLLRRRRRARVLRRHALQGHRRRRQRRADPRRSVMDVYMTMPHERRVLPGHTDETTIGREWEENPFVRVWRGVEPEGDEPVRVGGEDATLRRLVARLRRQGQGAGCGSRTAATRSSAARASNGNEAGQPARRFCSRSAPAWGRTSHSRAGSLSAEGAYERSARGGRRAQGDHRRYRADPAPAGWRELRAIDSDIAVVMTRAPPTTGVAALRDADHRAETAEGRPPDAPFSGSRTHISPWEIQLLRDRHLDSHTPDARIMLIPKAGA